MQSHAAEQIALDWTVQVRTLLLTLSAKHHLKCLAKTTLCFPPPLNKIKPQTEVLWGYFRNDNTSKQLGTCLAPPKPGISQEDFEFLFQERFQSISMNGIHVGCRVEGVKLTTKIQFNALSWDVWLRGICEKEL